MIDKNKILALFSATTCIDKEKMQNYFNENSIENFEAVYAEFIGLRENLFGYLWKITEPNLQLTQKEIAEISTKFLKEKYLWINDEGIKSVLDYTFWICWHEGLLLKQN
ncbi:hypothetical protein LRS05_05175 [Flavobacterium sp. J372]|uniref:hypothetical protein n=1 Tax=Flavobacterium sp. J372 TaxID=2898436 RepID=UPI0021514619|nr:hypothetical protein [Flavobacterium sp. J372]MCR5861569.1 hypothetical protein [Flavobacterium sp. J372]